MRQKNSCNISKKNIMQRCFSKTKFNTLVLAVPPPITENNHKHDSYYKLLLATHNTAYRNKTFTRRQEKLQQIHLYPAVTETLSAEDC